MLSTMSPAMSPSYAPSHDPSPAMAAPFAILSPRAPACPPHPLRLPQRPKLQINTQQRRTFGKGSSLRLDTLSAVSPTARNTFSNAYEAPSRPRLSIDSSLAQPADAAPASCSTPTSASTLSSTVTSASSTESATIAIPYKQPHNLTSILSNSPARHLIPRKMAAVRPLFPAEKRVSFRTPLEEEIINVKYTMAHFDLESSISSSSTISSIESSEDSEPSASTSAATTSASSDSPSSPSSSQSPSEQSSTPSSAFSSLEGSPRPRGARAGEKRDSSESDSDSAPETPVAGRRKRRRDWRWTLGPLPADKTSSMSSTSDITTSEDSE